MQLQPARIDEAEFQGIACARLCGDGYELRVPLAFGPRVLWLSYQDGPNLFAFLPRLTERTAHGLYRFWGGHRLWTAPETEETYWPEDGPLRVEEQDGQLVVAQVGEPGSGLRKSLELGLKGGRILVRHRVEALRAWEGAPWAITQLPPGGLAVLPQTRRASKWLPNRLLVLWPYTRLGDPRLQLGDGHIVVRGRPVGDPLKVGWSNEEGWLAYLRGGFLFRRHHHHAQARYPDMGASAECFTRWDFLELETLGPLVRLEPGEMTVLEEEWEVRAGVGEEEVLPGVR